jgi:hypothetical protein
MRTLRPTIMIVVVMLATELLGQSVLLQSFPASQTNQDLYGTPGPGSSCGIYSGATDPRRQGISVDPTLVAAPVNTPIPIRYDASMLCNGQGFLDHYGNDVGSKKFAGVGTITFEVGATETLTSLYGIATLFPGYAVAQAYTIQINLMVQCYDTGKHPTSITSCPASINIPVTVTDVRLAMINSTKGSAADQTTATVSAAPATLQFYAYANGTASDDSDMTQGVTWTSSDPNVATITSGLPSGNGLVTAVAAGTTNIAATIKNSAKNVVKSQTIVLTVR